VNLAFVGLGTMGGVMAARLLGAGHRVTGYDVRADALDALAQRGGAAAESPADAATNAEIVLTSLPSSESARTAILDSERGVIAGLGHGGMLIEMSTISMSLIQEVHETFADRGFQVLDAPVTQSTGMVSTGRMTVMVGGEAEVLERVRPVLEVLGSNIIHLGGPGAGMASKLATQYAGLCNLLAAGEAIRIATGYGADINRFRELGPNSLASSRMFDIAANWIQHAGDVETIGFVSIFEKDIRLGAQAAAEAGVRHDLGQATAELFADALERGWAQENYLTVLDLLSEGSEATVTQDGV
jgi:3-hydroxyisobutyrate dehydrogenase-like beta-hydroxyacid dehydrogenase